MKSRYGAERCNTFTLSMWLMTTFKRSTIQMCTDVFVEKGGSTFRRLTAWHSFYSCDFTATVTYGLSVRTRSVLHFLRYNCFCSADNNTTVPSCTDNSANNIPNLSPWISACCLIGVDLQGCKGWELHAQKKNNNKKTTGCNYSLSPFHTMCIKRTSFFRDITTNSRSQSRSSRKFRICIIHLLFG